MCARRLPVISMLRVTELGGAAFAHHSFAQFDTQKTVQLTGAMRALEWQNPHSWMDLNKSDGSVATWGGEFAGAPSGAGRRVRSNEHSTPR